MREQLMGYYRRVMPNAPEPQAGHAGLGDQPIGGGGGMEDRMAACNQGSRKQLYICTGLRHSFTPVAKHWGRLEYLDLLCCWIATELSMV